MKPPLVSILIPAYNAERTIAYTIQSALDQTWPNKEIIVVNDGSKDLTLQAARRFESASVKVIDQKNQGAAAARNRAFAQSQGDYIQWLDADDLLSREKVERQMAVLASSSPRTIASAEWGSFKHRSAKAKFSPSPLWADLTPLEWLIRKWEHNAHMQTATWLVSRALTAGAGGWDTRLLGDDDGEFFFRVLLQCEQIRFVPEAKVYYREPNQSGLSFIGSSARKIEAQFVGMKKQIAALRSVQDDDRVRAACVTYLQTWFIYLYPERPDLVEEAQQLARQLGGSLVLPKLKWKYAWLQPLVGFSKAKRAQLTLPTMKNALTNRLDAFLYRFERAA